MRGRWAGISGNHSFTPVYTRQPLALNCGMTNNNSGSDTTRDIATHTTDTTTVVYSAENGGVTNTVQPAAAQVNTVQVDTAQAVTSADVALEGERVLYAASGTSAPTQTGWQPDVDDVEYQPMAYTDPGEVTEQFDHLATRNPQEMEAIIGGGHPLGHGSQENEVFSPEAAALAGGNETTMGAERGAVTRLESNAYDLADTTDVKVNPK